MLTRRIFADTGTVARHTGAVHTHIEQESEDDPQPGRSRHAVTEGVDDHVRQRGDREEDDPKQGQNPAVVEGSFYQRRLEPDDQQPHTREEPKQTSHETFLLVRTAGLVPHEWLRRGEFVGPGRSGYNGSPVQQTTSEMRRQIGRVAEHSDYADDSGDERHEREHDVWLPVVAGTRASTPVSRPHKAGQRQSPRA
jgi:hypothetical protein